MGELTFTTLLYPSPPPCLDQKAEDGSGASLLSRAGGDQDCAMLAVDDGSLIRSNRFDRFPDGPSGPIDALNMYG